MLRRPSRGLAHVIYASFLFAVLLMSASPSLVLAQDATPTVRVGEVIDPRECQVEPITADKLVPLWFPEGATPVSVLPAVEPELTSLPLPIGEPADPATAAGIHAAVRELLACQNRIDNGRFYALVTDDLLRQWGPFPGETPADIPAHLAPFEAIPVEEQARLLAVTDVSIMADGRVAALVIQHDPAFPTTEGAQTVLMLFVEGEGRWLLDAVATFTAGDLLLEEESASSASTPTP